MLCCVVSKKRKGRYNGRRLDAQRRFLPVAALYGRHGRECDVGSNADNPPTLDLVLLLYSYATYVSDHASSCVLHFNSYSYCFVDDFELDTRRLLLRAFYRRAIHGLFIITAISNHL